MLSAIFEAAVICYSTNATLGVADNLYRLNVGNKASGELQTMQ